MTGNLSVAIMRRADTSQKGYVEEMDLVNLLNDDPVSYGLIEDLANFAPDFMDTHRQVLNGQGQGRSGGVGANSGGPKMRSSVNAVVAAQKISSQQR